MQATDRLVLTQYKADMRKPEQADARKFSTSCSFLGKQMLKNLSTSRNLQRQSLRSEPDPAASWLACRLDAKYEEVRGASLAKLRSSSSFQLASDGWAQAVEAVEDSTRLINIMVNIPSGCTLFQKAGIEPFPAWPIMGQPRHVHARCCTGPEGPLRCSGRVHEKEAYLLDGPGSLKPCHELTATSCMNIALDVSWQQLFALSSADCSIDRPAIGRQGWFDHASSHWADDITVHFGPGLFQMH